jgi:hypothetical protein
MAQDNFATFAETLFHDSHEFGIASVRFGEITNRLNRGSVTLLLVLFLSLSAISATPGNSDSALSTHSFRSYKTRYQNLVHGRRRRDRDVCSTPVESRYKYLSLIHV